MSSSSPNKLDDFEVRAVFQYRGRPLAAADDAAVDFHRNPFRVEFECLDQPGQGLTWCDSVRFAVQNDADR